MVVEVGRGFVDFRAYWRATLGNFGEVEGTLAKLEEFWGRIFGDLRKVRGCSRIFREMKKWRELRGEEVSVSREIYGEVGGSKSL